MALVGRCSGGAVAAAAIDPGQGRLEAAGRAAAPDHWTLNRRRGAELVCVPYNTKAGVSSTRRLSVTASLGTSRQLMPFPARDHDPGT